MVTIKWANYCLQNTVQKTKDQIYVVDVDIPAVFHSQIPWKVMNKDNTPSAHMQKQFYDVYVSKSNKELFGYTLKKTSTFGKKIKVKEQNRYCSFNQQSIKYI